MNSSVHKSSLYFSNHFLKTNSRSQIARAKETHIFKVLGTYCHGPPWGGYNIYFAYVKCYEHLRQDTWL